MQAYNKRKRRIIFIIIIGLILVGVAFYFAFSFKLENIDPKTEQISVLNPQGGTTELQQQQTLDIIRFGESVSDHASCNSIVSTICGPRPSPDSPTSEWKWRTNRDACADEVFWKICEPRIGTCKNQKKPWK